MKVGPSSSVFKILRLFFLLLLLASIVLFILGIVLVLSRFRQVNEWKNDSDESTTEEQKQIIRALKVSTALSCVIVVLGMVNLIFGIFGIITLRTGSFLLFVLIATVCVILSITQLCFIDEPDISIGWLLLHIFEVMALIMMIRELRSYESDQIRKRVEEADSPDDL
jgi:magnesium-transporting ATPase (P-type)